MTSNGLALHHRLPDFVHRGLTHLNLRSVSPHSRGKSQAQPSSLDTLDPFKFEAMARRPGHGAVLRALDVALSCRGLRSLKLNVVVVKGLNDYEVLDFVELTKDKRLSVRFIEFMPFTGDYLSCLFLSYSFSSFDVQGNKWNKAKMIPSMELLDIIQRRHPTIERAPDELNDTARSWQIPGYMGNIGFISSMSDHFCSSCNRLRLTADGQIKARLYLHPDKASFLTWYNNRSVCSTLRRSLSATRFAVMQQMKSFSRLSGLPLSRRKRSMREWGILMF